MVFETEIKPKIDNQTYRHETDRHTDTNHTDLVAFRAREGTDEEKDRREGEEGEGEIGEIPKLITFCLLGVTLPAARDDNSVHNAKIQVANLESIWATLVQSQSS